MGIVKNLFSRKKNEEEPAVATMPARATPKLMMLMPDASGIASYQLHTFVAASEAEEYLVSILRGDVQDGTIMASVRQRRPGSRGRAGRHYPRPEPPGTRLHLLLRKPRLRL